MNQVLNEIKSVPGITGGFFYASDRGVGAVNLPAVFRKTNLAKIGKVIEKMVKMSNTGLSDVTELCLYYEESIIVARPIDQTVFLILLCDPSINQNLLTMTLNMHAKEIRDNAAHFDTHDSTAGQDDMETGHRQPSQRPVPVDDLLKNSPVAGELRGINNALYKIMGPMAKIIFKDALRDWSRLSPLSKESLSALLDLLKTEINDDEKEEKFSNLVSENLKNSEDNMQ